MTENAKRSTGEAQPDGASYGEWNVLSKVEFNGGKRELVAENVAQEQDPTDILQDTGEEPQAETVELPKNSAADLLAGLKRNRRNLETYGDEVMGKQIEEFAPEYIENEAYLQEAVRALTGQEDQDSQPQRRAEDISANEIIEYCQNDRKTAVGRFNRLNTEIHDLDQTLNIFTRHFGKGAKRLKEMRAEQDDCQRKIVSQDHRISLVESILGIEGEKKTK